MHSLPLFLKISGQPVILIGKGDAADAKQRLIERAGGMIVGEADSAARIAFVALEDQAAATDAAARLKARGLLVNVADRPDLCDFTTPAIVDRDPVLIAVSTGGASAGLAATLRQRLEQLLPGRLGQLARDLHTARDAMRAKWPDSDSRRRALTAALSHGGAIDPFGNMPDVKAWIESDGSGPVAEIYSLELQSTDPDQMNLRDARALGSADRIVHAGDVPDAILARARADAARLILPPDASLPDAPGLTVVLRVTAM